MITFQGLYQRATTLISDSSSATETLIKSLINESYKKAFRTGSFEYIGEYIRFTSANQDTYTTPNDMERMRDVQLIETSTGGTTDGTTSGKLVDSTASFADTVVDKRVGNTTDNTFTKITAKDSATTLTVENDIFTSGEGYQIGDGLAYISTPIYDDDTWNLLKSPQVNSTTDVLSNHRIIGNNIQLYPTPATDNQMLVMSYSRRVRDMTADDYTTGTVSTTKGSRTVTGSTTVFTSDMVGRFINLNGYWYEISGFSSATSITLLKSFQEENLSSVSYTIGELPRIPEHFQETLAYEAIAFAYRRREQLDIAREYESLWREAMRKISQYGGSNDESMQVHFGRSGAKFTDSSKNKLIISDL